MRAMTAALDTVFGKLLDAVDAVDANTYVIFISDNGTPMYGRLNLDFIENLNSAAARFLRRPLQRTVGRLVA